MDSSSPQAGAGAPFEAEHAAGAVCPVKLPIFEGPLDLLLHLIRQNELDITDLPVARIAEQYLEYLGLLRELQLDVAGEYLLMAATLAWIKSRMLLPPEAADEEEEGPDPRADLVARLLEYQRYKEVAEDLGSRPRLERDVFAPCPAETDPIPEGEREIEVGLVELLEAFRRVLGRARSRRGVHEVAVEPVAVSDRMRAILAALERDEHVELQTLFYEEPGRLGSRSWIVSTFLAILELARLSTLRIYQSFAEAGHPRGPIRLRRAVSVADPRWREAVAGLG